MSSLYAYPVTRTYKFLHDFDVPTFPQPQFYFSERGECHRTCLGVTTVQSPKPAPNPGFPEYPSFREQGGSQCDPAEITVNNRGPLRNILPWLFLHMHLVTWNLSLNFWHAHSSISTDLRFLNVSGVRSPFTLLSPYPSPAASSLRVCDTLKTWMNTLGLLCSNTRPRPIFEGYSIPGRSYSSILLCEISEIFLSVFSSSVGNHFTRSGNVAEYSRGKPVGSESHRTTPSKKFSHGKSCLGCFVTCSC